MHSLINRLRLLPRRIRHRRDLPPAEGDWIQPITAVAVDSGRGLKLNIAVRSSRPREVTVGAMVDGDIAPGFVPLKLFDPAAGRQVVGWVHGHHLAEEGDYQPGDKVTVTAWIEPVHGGELSVATRRLRVI